MIDMNLTLIFRCFEEVHLGKDVFLVPYYLGKRLGYEVTIVYPLTGTNKNLPSKVRGVNLVPLKSIGNFLIFYKLSSLKYLIRNAHTIDLLMQIHWGKYMAIMAFVYKKLKPNGKTYVKLDSDNDALFRKDYYLKYFVKYIDVFTCELLQAYREILSNLVYSSILKDKLILMPNGFDEEYLKKMHIHERLFEEKENLILTVGDLVRDQKNTQMLLRALEKIDLGEWKVYLIGPICELFEKYIEDFYMKCPNKKEQVLFTGPIYDKKQLWEYYNKAKVFVLTSKFESFALVLNEAKRFRNYLISTPVGAFRDLCDNGKLGISVSQNADEELAERLNEVILGELEIDVYNDYDVTSLSWERMVERIKI